MKNIDTRVQFTKQKFSVAIIELLQDKSIDRITVKELCDTAGLNRGTFYLHSDGSTRLILDWLKDSKGLSAAQFTKRVERLGHHALLAVKEF